MARKRNRFQFTGKSHSKKGILVSSLAAISLVMFVIFVALAVKSAGTLSMYYGSVGVLNLVMALILVVLAIQSVKEEDSFMLFPRVGLLLSVLCLVCWGGTYLAGFGLF